MARKQTEIKVISYVHVGDELVEFSQLTPEQRREAATQIKCKFLHAMFAGKAEFTPIKDQ
jgi:hypothetical protein